MKWWCPGFANAHSLEVLIQTSREILAPCIWRAVFLCSCSVMNCADSDHLCSWFSGLRFVYQIMSQWFIIVIRVVIKSSPNESFSLFSQASHKSLNLRLESSHVTRVPHLWYKVNNAWRKTGLLGIWQILIPISDQIALSPHSLSMEIPGKHFGTP